MAVLDLFRATAHLSGEDLHILCDSQYVINSVTKWMPGWKRKGWRKSDGKPVLNVELLKEIDQELRGRRYKFEWVRGHAGHDLNEAADERARAAATAYQQGVAVRQGPGFGSSPEAHSEARPQSVAPASLAAAPLLPAPLRAGGQELFGDAGGFEEPDLFSQLEEEPLAAPGTDASPEAVVEALERELLRPETRADLGRTGVLLHPDFTEIGSSGRIWTRDAMMMELEQSPQGAADLELLGADRLREDTVLLTYRSYARSGTTLRSSLWVREGTQWRLRFHQGTPEA